MPRFFFNLHDTHLAVDEEGYELADLNVARCVASEFLGATIKDAGLQLFDPLGWRLEVTDARGLILFAIDVHTENAPAVMSLDKPHDVARQATLR